MEKVKILIVEDEAIIAMEIENQLQSLGYEITSIVDTGEKAIKKAEEDKPDIILMDIRIKGEMDGIDTAHAIRSQFGIPVIFSTAYLDEDRIERTKITMPFGYVLKPIQERDLRVTTEMALYVAKVDKERRKVESRLIESEKQRRAWLENSPDCTKIVDLGFNLQYMSGAGVKSLRIDDITPYYGKPYPFEFYPDSFKIPMCENLAKAKETGETIVQEAPVVDVEGNEVWFHSTIVPVNDDEGKLDYLMVVSIDTTERKQAAINELRIKNQLQSVIDNSMSSISIKNLDGQYILVSQNFEKEFGIPKKKFIGKTDYDFLSKELADKYREQEQKIAKTGESLKKREEFSWNDETHTFIINKNPLFDSDGSVYAICVESLNLTLLTKTE
jgi:PAS domain S-box-containing protein